MASLFAWSMGNSTKIREDFCISTLSWDSSESKQDTLSRTALSQADRCPGQRWLYFGIKLSYTLYSTLTSNILNTVLCTVTWEFQAQHFRILNTFTISPRSLNFSLTGTALHLIRMIYRVVSVYACCQFSGHVSQCECGHLIHMYCRVVSIYVCWQFSGHVSQCGHLSLTFKESSISLCAANSWV